MTSFTAISLFSGACFLFYGFSCLLSEKMAAEFERFGIPQFLKLTGILQVLGGASLLIGIYMFPVLAFIGALGLSILMFMGFGLRLKIKDSFLLSAPALMFGFLNAFIAYKYYFIMIA
ncbi:MAG: DoxX family protein [Nonlabens sp.]|uniref:DoxX family protein n=1 Tax=Nonlabens sp. TaxID=1888209 RepID=UPI003EF516BD